MPNYNINMKIVKMTMMLICLLTPLCAQAITWQIGDPVAANITATLDNGTLTISGTGKMGPRTVTGSETIPWFTLRSQIKTVIIGQGITSIKEAAFMYCENLTSVTLPGSLTHIEGSAFAYCSSLTKLTVPNSVVSLGRSVFLSCKSLTSITLPEGLTQLEWGMFQSCSSLQSVILPKKIKVIDENAFIFCTSLYSITIPEGVTTIEYAAFNYCKSLTIIDLPSTLTNIGSGAFWECKSLKSITVRNPIPPQTKSSFFPAYSIIKETCTLRVPVGSESAYKEAKEWGNFLNIRNMDDSYVSVVSVDLEITQIDLKIGESFLLRAMVSPSDATKQAITWKSSKESVAIVSNGGLVTGIGVGHSVITASAEDRTVNCSVLVRAGSANSNFNVQNGVLTGYLGIGGDVVIPGNLGITTIGTEAFRQNKTVTSIVIPQGVTKIENLAFSECAALIAVDIPASVQTIGGSIFNKSTSLREVTVHWDTASDIPVAGLYDYFSKEDVAQVTLHVPAYMKSAYQDLPGWKDFGTIDDGTMLEGSLSVFPVESLPENYRDNQYVLAVTELLNASSGVPQNFKRMLNGTDTYVMYVDSIFADKAFLRIENLTTLGRDYGFLYNGMSNYQLGALERASWKLNIIGGQSGQSISFDFRNAATNNYLRVPNYLGMQQYWEKDVNNHWVFKGKSTDPIFKGGKIDNLDDDYAINSWFFSHTYASSLQRNIPLYSYASKDSVQILVLDEETEAFRNPATGRANSGGFTVTVKQVSIIDLMNGNPSNVLLFTLMQVGGDQNTTLSVSPPSLNFAAAGEIKLLDITSNSSWTVSGSNDEWLAYDPVSGIGDSTVRVAARANPTASQRTATITIIGAGLAAQTIRVTQSATVQSGEKSWPLSPTMVAVLNREGVLTISTTANAEAMPDFEIGGAPWQNDRYIIFSVVINDKITSIGDYSFNEFENLTSITIPGSVTAIGTMAFGFCRNLASIMIPNSVKSIGHAAFFYCESLTSITIPNTVTAIGPSAFEHCINLKSVSMPHSVTTIERCTFLSCENLTSITIPSSVKSIGHAAFYGCTALPSITIPNSVTTIGYEAFGYCSNLNSVTVAWNTPLAVNLSDNLFIGTNPSTIILHVPSGTKSLYEAADVWKEFGMKKETAILINETQQINKNGNGHIELCLLTSCNMSLTGSFEIQFPLGMALDEDLSKLSVELAVSSTLSIVSMGNNKWLAEIKPNSLGASAIEYRKIMDIVYTAKEEFPNGIYEATISNLHFEMNDGTIIKEAVLNISINVDQSPVTSIEKAIKTPALKAFFVDNQLRVESAHREVITIYSITGTQLFSTVKNGGKLDILLPQFQGTILIINGSKSGTVKLLKFN